MCISTLVSIAATFLNTAINPLFLGLGMSALLLIPAILLAPPTEMEIVDEEI